VFGHHNAIVAAGRMRIGVLHVGRPAVRSICGRIDGMLGLMTIRSRRALKAGLCLGWGGAAALFSLPLMAAHPTVYFGSAELAQLKTRAADSSTNALGYDFASAFKALRDEADGYKDAPYTVVISVPNPDGLGTQSWSYTLSSSLPPAHSSNPGYPTWTQVTRELEKRLETLSFVYAITGDGSYLTNSNATGAIDAALLIAAWSQWTDPQPVCGNAGSCLDTAHLTFGMSMAYDVGFDTMTDAQRSIARDAIVHKGVEKLAADVTAANSKPSGMSDWFNGYALRVAGLGVGACAVAQDVGATADPWLKLARDSTQLFFGSQGKQGGTYEGQLYGSYALDNLVIGAHALARNNAANDLFTDPWLRDLPRFASVFLGSDNHSEANLGDSSADASWAGTMFALASRGDAIAQWYLTARGQAKPGNFLRFVWARPDLQPTPIVGSGSAWFADVGHAVLRAGFSGAPVVAVKSGPTTMSIGHNHLDHNSFILNAFGEWIAADPGYESYYNTAQNVYTTGTVGHNTLMVDKSVSSDGTTATGGQSLRAGGKLDAFMDGEGYAKVVGNAEATYPAGLLSRFARHVLYGKPEVVLVFDDIASSDAHGYSFLLHASASGSFSTGDGPGEMRTAQGSARLQTFVTASNPLQSGYPRSASHPGAESYGPYAEWRTTPAKTVRFAAGLVPAKIDHVALANPGFENGLTNWQPRRTDGSHVIDDTVRHGGQQSARITQASTNTGYFYSEPLQVAASGALTAGVFVRASGATGTLLVRPAWMKGSEYIANSAGKTTTLDATQAADWVEIKVETTVPASGVDHVRIVLQFEGSGTVWFDDVSFSSTGMPPADPLSVAVELGTPSTGLAIQGPFGIEAAATMVGSAPAGVVQLKAATTAIAAVPSLSSDATLFAIGLQPDGSFKRAFLQQGTLLAVGDTQYVRAASASTLDVAAKRDGVGCMTLFVTEDPALRGFPYTVRAAPSEVRVGGERVAFVQNGAEATFPSGSDLGLGCSDNPRRDAGGGQDGGGGGDSGADASMDTSAGSDSAMEGGGDTAGPESAETPEDSGCGCRTAGNRSTGTQRTGLLALLALAVLRRTARWTRAAVAPAHVDDRRPRLGAEQSVYWPHV
jgi:hypothetical protein